MKTKTIELRDFENLDTVETYDEFRRVRWPEFVRHLAEVIDELYQNDLLSQLQPGTVILSFNQGTSEMPGFIRWENGMELRRELFPRLFEIVGDGGSTDPETFKLPDIENRILQVAGFRRAANNGDTFDTDVSGIQALKLTAWIRKE